MYLNDCVILERFSSNSVAVYLVIQNFPLSQLHSNSNYLPQIYFEKLKQFELYNLLYMVAVISFRLTVVKTWIM